MQGAYRLPVVAELGVIVVFDDCRVMLGRPSGQRHATSRCQHDAGRPLVGGGGHDRPDATGRQRADVDDSTFDPNWYRLQARPRRVSLAGIGVAGSSNATRRKPESASTRRARARPWANPAQITILSGSAAAARTRRR